MERSSLGYTPYKDRRHLGGFARSQERKQDAAMTPSSVAHADDEESSVTGPDPILGALVDIVNDARANADTVTLTLIVNGAVVSGELLPAWRWMKLVDEQLGGSTFLGERAEALAEEARLAWVANDPPAQPWTAERVKTTDRTSQFVHLQNAQIVTGHDDYPPTLWRVRLTDVSGWCYGALRTAPAG